MLRQILRALAVLLTLPLVAATPQAPLDAAGVTALLDRLSSTGTALYVAAHPDDENTAMLSYLVSEKGFRTGYLSVTRGDGGQNLIGGEKGDYLGVIRTQELLAARRIDRAEQFFTRAVDFGYSKTPEETFRIWGKEEVLGDVVFVIRKFRPDVIVTRFPTTGEGGHGHHTASAILALEAFTAAADPTRFPEQLNVVKPWQAKRIFWNAFRFNPNEPIPADFLKVDIGTYNEVLGRSYTEIAGQSRSMHKSQGFGAAERRGSLLNYLRQLGGEPAGEDPFAGLDSSWKRFIGGNEIEKSVASIRRKYDTGNPTTILPDLLALHRLIAANPEPIAQVRKKEVETLIRSVSGLWVEAIADRPSSAPIDSVNVSMAIVNRSIAAMTITSIDATGQGSKGLLSGLLKTNEPFRGDLEVGLRGLDPTQPYWLTKARSEGLHHVPYFSDLGMPENAPPLVIKVNVEIAGAPFTFEAPVLYRYTDRVRGEIYEPFVVVPRVTLGFDEPLLLFTDDKTRKVRVYVTNQATLGISPEIRLNAEEGWKVAPARVSGQLEGGKGERFVAEFTVTPPARASAGNFQAEAVFGAQTFSRGIATIDYDHIPKQTLFPAAILPALRVDLKRGGNRIGYIMGAGDEIPDILRQAGYKVTLVTDEMLAGGGLGEFDAIVVGVRAFNSRESLKRAPEPLFDFAKAGGTVVVQYNTADNTLGKSISPLMLKVGRDRVTVEGAPVTFVDAKHPLLNTPNKLTAADFDGWVQERGLYFPSEWDPKFEPVLEMNDPGEPAKKGSLLYARHGKGVFIYTGISFFRQLPAAVPGALRLFANVIAKRTTGS